MNEQKLLYWFRDDLRLHDLPLFNQIGDSCQILPIYIVNPKDYEITSLGFSKTGAFRSKFIQESVLNLRENLRKAGSDLLILYGSPIDLIPSLVEEYAINSVCASKALAWDEIQIELLLKEKLSTVNCNLLLAHQNFLFHPEDISYNVNDVPDIFTVFRKTTEKVAKVRTVEKTVISFQTISFNRQNDLEIEVWQTTTTFDSRSVLPFDGGETAALARLRQYIWEQDLLKSYKETRNGLIGADYSSKFSAYLAIGSISPRLIYEEVKKYENERIANDSTYWLLFELMWRDYFRYVTMKYNKSIFLKQGIKGFLEKSMYDNHVDFKKWINGQTSEPFVNANMLELKQTGFMSNRGRQNVASYLINDLKVNWQWGARYFESALIDYDVHSNWCNWNYIAGVGTDPRENRYFNIRKQAEMYDPDGKYVRLWSS